jgi:hypothetical protein
LSSTELETVSTLNRSNGNTTDTSGAQNKNAFASSSKSVLPMHSLIDTAPSPLPLVTSTTSSTSSSTVIPEYVPTGAIVPRTHNDSGIFETDTSADATLPAVPTDGRTLCVRHQMMADQDVNGKLQRVSLGVVLCCWCLTFRSPWMHCPFKRERLLRRSGPLSARHLMPRERSSSRASLPCAVCKCLSHDSNPI